MNTNAPNITEVVEESDKEKHRSVVRQHLKPFHHVSKNKKQVAGNERKKPNNAPIASMVKESVAEKGRGPFARLDMTGEIHSDKEYSTSSEAIAISETASGITDQGTITKNTHVAFSIGLAVADDVKTVSKKEKGTEESSSEFFEIDVGHFSRVSRLGIDMGSIELTPHDMDSIEMSAVPRESVYKIQPLHLSPFLYSNGKGSKKKAQSNNRMTTPIQTSLLVDGSHIAEKSAARSILDSHNSSSRDTKKDQGKCLGRKMSKRRNQICTLFAASFLCGIIAVIIWVFNDQEALSGSENSDTAAPEIVSAPDISPAVKDCISSQFGSDTALSLEDVNSPQFQAARWIEEEDYVFDFPISDLHYLAFRQRYAVATFFFSTEGKESWNYGINFLSSRHECDWNHGPVYGVSCNTARDVTGIRVVFNGLKGTIPPEFGTLKTLEAISLNGNNIGGSLPTEFYELKNLKTLSLTGNKLTGSLSSSIRNLQKLTSLDLRDNFLEGTIPSAVSKLPLLESLDVSLNKFTGGIPQGGYDVLRDFAAGMNQLTGSFPNFILGSSLQVLTLHSNRLAGALPSGVWSLAPSLTMLDVSDNSFSGPIPRSLGSSLRKLVVFRAKDAQLTGTLPDLDQDSLKVLNLEENSLIGSVPMSYANLPLCE
jgi:Leucine-rich repeat (LRR) protein